MNVLLYLQPLHGELCGEPRRERGQHDDDKEPVSGHQQLRRVGGRGLPSAQGGHRLKDEPEGLPEGEDAGGIGGRVSGKNRCLHVKEAATLQPTIQSLCK